MLQNRASIGDYKVNLETKDRSDEARLYTGPSVGFETGICHNPPKREAVKTNRMCSLSGGQGQQACLEEQFVSAAELLDAAGLGPADYLYSPLKWRLQHPETNHLPLLRCLLTGCRLVIFDPPTVPRNLRQAPILAASSYSVSANLLRQVVAGFDSEKALLCDASDIESRPLSTKLPDILRSLFALKPALTFALRARATLIKAGMASVESNRIAQAALIHATHRSTARAILKKVRPKCLVIGNGNRPFEFSLWAEARAGGIATVLLPFADINLKPARLFSLCRGDFDLVLPFSEYSALQMRKLRPDVSVQVVGFPPSFNTTDTEAVTEKNRTNVLYISGNNFEEAASGLIREAFEDCEGLRLRVRLHPRNRGSEIRELFGWLGKDHISDPLETSLADDIANSDVVVAVRSTTALDAMIARVPMVWLSPRAHREELERHPIRQQKLALFDATTSIELRTVVQMLVNDEDERRRVVEEQWSRLIAGGYCGNYFNAVRAALSRLAGNVVPSSLPLLR